MNDPTLTAWFVDGQLPVRPGVYSVSCNKTAQTGMFYARFFPELQLWSKFRVTAELAGREVLAANDTPHFSGSWRGVANADL